MKYLLDFFLNENIAQAKSFLKGISISENDPDFIKIKEMLKGHEGYIFWFTKLKFSDRESIENLQEIWNIIKDNSGLVSFFNKKIVDLKDSEEFWDQYERAKLVSSAKKVLNQFPANQKRFFSLDDDKDFDLLINLSKSKSLPALIKKISSFRDKSSLLAAANRLLTSSFDGKFGELIKTINDCGAEVNVVDEEHNIIICNVNYKQIKVLGGDTSWCIVRAESTFNSYAAGGFQWVIFLVDNFGKNDRYSKIGLTTHIGYTTAHDKYDGYIDRQKLSEILKERGVDINDLFMSRENLLALSDWDSVPVEILVDKQISKEEILKRKTLFRDRSKYGRAHASKNDIDCFTKEEIEKWDLTERVEITWQNLSKMDVTIILQKDLINKLDYPANFQNIIDTLKLTKEQILENELYKSDKVYTNETTLSFFTKEEIIKFKIVNYLTHPIPLTNLFTNILFTKEEILKFQIYLGNVSIDARSLGYFTKDELLKYKIIDKASNIPFNILLNVGFTKEEIVKNYSNSLDQMSKTVTTFFKDKTKVEIRNRLSATFWSNDLEKIGIERDGLNRFKLLAMSMYDINSTVLNLVDKNRSDKNLSNLFYSGDIELTKENIDTLYNLGFKITDKTSFDSFTRLLKLSNGDFEKLSSIIKFRRILKDDELVYKLSTEYLLKVLSSRDRFYFDYFDFIRDKPTLSSVPEWPQILKVLKSGKLGGYYLSDLRTKTSNGRSSSYRDFDMDNTIRFIKELEITKEDIEASGGILKFCNVFKNDASSVKVGRVLSFFEEMGYKNISKDDEVEIIGELIDNAYSTNRDKDDKLYRTYKEEYYRKLVSRDLKVEDSLVHIFNYFKERNKISSYEEESYLEMFKKGGDKWVKKYNDELKVVKKRELQYMVLSELKNVFGSYRSSRLTPQQWYDKYFKYYKEIPQRIHSWNTFENGIKVMWVLASIDKFDEIDNLELGDINSKERGGLSFDHNKLHSLAKIICKVDSAYERDFKTISLSDEQTIKLYKWLLTKVDEKEFWVRKYLIVCYYLYDKRKYNKFISDIANIKNNYSVGKYNRQGEYYASDTITLRIDAVYAMVKYFAKKDNFDEFEKIINTIMQYKKPGTPRDLKMTSAEYKYTLSLIDRISGPNREFRDKRDLLLTKIKSEFEKVKESILLNWSQFKLK